MVGVVAVVAVVAVVQPAAQQEAVLQRFNLEAGAARRGAAAPGGLQRGEQAHEETVHGGSWLPGQLGGVEKE
jgi:hypothetical protein